RPERLRQPLDWKRSKLIFVNSMSDLFHEDVPTQFIQDVFETMRLADWHTFQILTKRPERLAEIANSLPWPENVWMGVSVENQRFTTRIDQLRTVPAAVRFLSCEPLLGALMLNLQGIGWVIAGGESGPGARRMKPEWVRGIRDQCDAAGVPFFFKQWGAYNEAGVRMGKHRSGRLLDDQLWNGYPSFGSPGSASSKTSPILA
ncbi:MAG TPA: phage Gp37/Gp68 family protein, partial [Dehalococcoidia bacterium]|nr:phage Gp37/Gp68 family protein [Dehalococcoidia bacterium]